MKTTKKVLVGLLAGATAGALLGVMLAPDKGSITRRRIIGKSGEFADDMNDKFNDFVDKTTAKAENISQQSDDLIAKGKKKFEETKKNVVYTTM